MDRWLGWFADTVQLSQDSALLPEVTGPAVSHYLSNWTPFDSWVKTIDDMPHLQCIEVNVWEDMEEYEDEDK